MESAPGFGGGGDTSKWAKRPVEPRVDAANLYLLMRGYSTSSKAIADWRSSLLLRQPLLLPSQGGSVAQRS